MAKQTKFGPTLTERLIALGVFAASSLGPTENSKRIKEGVNRLPLVPDNIDTGCTQESPSKGKRSRRRRVGKRKAQV